MSMQQRIQNELNIRGIKAPAYFKSDLVSISHNRTKERISRHDLEILESFPSHGLSDLKGAELMDRVDTKFILPIKKLPFILAELKSDYSILEIQNKRIFTYYNTYFDTEDHRFYHMHHQGKLNRYKVRHRHYLDSDTGFLEVKFKNNKGRTLKSRIPLAQADINTTEAQTFLSSEFNLPYKQLKPSQFGSYQRIALANEASCERITFDLNLSFFSKKPQDNIHLPKLFIAELKQGRHNRHSPFARLMARLDIRSSKFSKYCIGCALVDNSLKANRFKPELMTLQKLH